MKAINILGIVLSIAGFITSFYYIEQCWTARWASWSYYTPDTMYPGYTGPTQEDVTLEGGLIIVVFTLFFVMLNIANMVKIKTTTTKVLSIIGVSMNGIVFIFNALSIAMPYHMWFDETTGPVWCLFAPVMLAFSIVFFVQTVLKRSAPLQNMNTLDDIIKDDII